MQLTDSDQEKIRKWLESKAGQSVRCFVCGGNQWSLTPSGSLVVGYDIHSGRIHYMDGYPMLGLICGNCGHIVWFSAVVMGFLPVPMEVEAAQQEMPADQP